MAQNRSGTCAKAARSAREEARLDQHVVVEQADVRVAGAGDPAVHRAGERERLRRDLDCNLRPIGAEPIRGAILRAVIHHDDLGGEALQVADDAGKLRRQQMLAVARGDDHRDARGPSGVRRG